MTTIGSLLRTRSVAYAGFILLTLPMLLPAETPTLEQVRVAPVIPAREEPLNLFVREIGGGDPRGTATWILRYGARGSLQRPGVLNIPPVGRAFVLHAYDIVAPTRRVVEVRRLPDYRSWLEFTPGTLALPVSGERFELLHGHARWNAERHEAEDLRLTAGTLTIRGRGEVRIERNVFPEDTVRLEVLRGRFEIYRDEELTSVLGAGQTRSFTSMPEDQNTSEEDRRGGPAAGHPPAAEHRPSAGHPPATEHEIFLERFNRHREYLEQRLHDATLLLFGGPLSGETLSVLWNAVLRFGPLYGYAEANTQPGLVNPDLALHALGETLRLLAAFAWEAPEGTIDPITWGR